MTLAQTQSEAEGILGPIDWLNEVEGYIDCPGKHLHGNRSGPKDTKVFIDGAPTVFCVHTSCEGAIADANRDLRRKLGERSAAPTLKLKGRTLAQAQPMARPIQAPANRGAYLKQKRKEAKIKAAFTRQLDVILGGKWDWPLEAIGERSPLAPPKDPQGDWELFLGLFEGQEGCLWVGDVTDSGAPEHAANFRTVDDWMSARPVGNFTCPSLFAPGTVSRSNKNVLSRPFMVMESDELTHDQMGAVLHWFAIACNWKIRAIVHTGGKSLHGWFEMPPPEWLSELEIAFECLKLDRAMIKPSQPVRLPGQYRQDKKEYQRLIYIDPT